MQLRTSLPPFLLALTCLAFSPAAAWAQSAIAGVVKDTSGARDARRDRRGLEPRADRESALGRHRRPGPVQDRRPAPRRLHGHLHAARASTPSKREAVELPTNFTATINAELRVGALEETVTVSGAVAGRRRAERGAADGADARRCSTPCRPAAASRRSARCCRARGSRFPTSAARPACRTAI